MKEPKVKPKVKLVEQDGNAFAIIGKVQKALRKAGADRKYVAKYFDEATKGDYDNLLSTTMKYVDVS